MAVASKAEISKKTITVLGAGSWGTALASVLARNGRSVRIWDIDSQVLEGFSSGQNTRYLPGIDLPPGITGYASLEEALTGADYCLIGVPSVAFAAVMTQIKPLITSHQGIICASKGLEPKTARFLHQVAEQILGQAERYAILSGPSFAREVAMGMPTAVTVAARNLSYALEVAEHFQNPHFCLYTTQDLIGVQLGAVVKNVLAVAVGISDGLALGANARAALITRGLAEMIHLGEALGASPATLMGLAGCGDVILTCTDNQSRNRRFGLALAEGLSEAEALQKIGQVVEALHNVEQLCQLARERDVTLPISEQVFNIIKHNIAPREALMKLFASAPQSESLANTVKLV